MSQLREETPLHLPERIESEPEPDDAETKARPKKDGLFIALGMMLVLGLLVYLNMG